MANNKSSNMLYIKLEAQAGELIENVADSLVAYKKDLPNYIYPVCVYEGVELIAWNGYTKEDIVEKYYSIIRFK